MTDDINGMDVAELLTNLYERDITSVRTPDGTTVVFHFELDSHDTRDTEFEGGRYALEVSLTGPHVWLHDYDADPTETLWENKSSRY